MPLEITGLTKRYHDGQLAVDELSLRVEHGQILGLLGPNGAGKTTTLRIADGPDPPGRGHDHDLRAAGPARCARAVPARLVRGGARVSCRTCPAGPTWTCTGGRPGARPATRTWREVLEIAGLGDGHRPAGPHLLAGHAPAAGDRPGHARPAGPAGARRADERARPAADQGDARRAAPVRGRRPDRDPVQPPARPRSSRPARHVVVMHMGRRLAAGPGRRDHRRRSAGWSSAPRRSERAVAVLGRARRDRRRRARTRTGSSCTRTASPRPHVVAALVGRGHPGGAGRRRTAAWRTRSWP